MRLLVTRPLPDASETVARLEALGHEVLVQPLLEVEFSPPPADLSQPAAILFTSRNAVRAVEAWPGATNWRDVPVFAVGRETAASSRKAGFADVRIGHGDARALADLVMAELDPANGTILLPTARDPAFDLADILATKGYSVRRIEAYRTIPADKLDGRVADALRRGRLDGALFFSRRTAATFVDLIRAANLDKAAVGLTLFSLSHSVAEPLSRIAGATICVADQPTSESLLALIPSPLVGEGSAP